MQMISAEDKQFFQEQGYLIVKGLFSQEETDELKMRCFSYWLDKVRKGEIIQERDNPLDSLFPRLPNIHEDDQQFLPYMLHEKVMDILEELTGEEMLAFLQNYYFKAPGSSAIPMHQDNYDTCAEPGTTYAAWISIDATDAENGGLYFIPGTQFFPILADESKIAVPEGYPIVDIVTEPGDVVFFGGNIYHGSYANQTSNRFRNTFLTHYVPASIEKIAIGHNHLINRHGQKIRRRYNLSQRYHHA
jgi:hypothetical protein